jgi:hypothetical protein
MKSTSNSFNRMPIMRYIARLSSLAVIITLLLVAMAGVHNAHADRTTEAVLRQELARVRQATARYHNVSQAEAAGYEDIGLFVPGQGYHYLNSSLVDDTFDLENPEILVYAPTPNRGLRLVAVEYAVPDSFPVPEGFFGDSDVWDDNLDFNLWTLHAWVWQGNPNGIFADSNPNVP